jgi:hypothetical protein
MAKKSAHSEEELPFAALMDVMTNVVGVLIIVLVMTGITLAQVAKKVIAEMEIVTEEEMKEVKKKAEQAKVKIDPEKIKQEMKKIEQEIKAVPKIERPPVKVNQKLADLEALKAKIEEAKVNRDKEKQQIDTYLAKIEDLKKRLDKKPTYVPPPPPETLKMPNPRPMPKTPKMYHFWVTSNSIISNYADPNFQTDFKNSVKQFAKQSGLSGPKVELDATQLWDFLNKNFIPKYKDLSINQYGWHPWHGVISLWLTGKDDPSAPPPAEQVKMGSQFYNVLKEIAAKDAQNGVAFFHVLEGGMDNYVRAREVADRLKLNIGWDMRAGADLRMGDQPWNIFGIDEFEGVKYSRKFDPKATPPPRGAATPDTRLIKGRSGSTLD